MLKRLWQFAPILLCLAAALPATVAWAQPADQGQPVQNTDAPLVIDGVVREVFRNVKPGRTDYLLQIEVLRSEGRKPVRAAAPLQFPDPGETVYVHIHPPSSQPGRRAPEARDPAIPEELSTIRAYLAPRELGGWEGASTAWFDVITDDADSTDSPAPDDRTAEATPRQPAASSLGITIQPLKIENRLALRVMSVERGSAAQQAGLEEGDVIVGANGAALQNANQLEELARRGAAFSLLVVDVNTGRGAQIEVTPQPPQVADSDAPAPPAAAKPAKISLGLSAEPAKLGSRSVLKVTRVEPNSPAAQAGLEVGDIVVAANGVPTTGPEQLLSALRKSGPEMQLTVRDSRTRKDVEINVSLNGARPANPLPTDIEPPPEKTASQLGAVTELVFHDDEFAVKVTEVETGSPAAAAGLLPGALILAANGKPVLHPTELNDAVRQSGRTLTLTVLDPLSGKTIDVNIDLGK